MSFTAKIQADIDNFQANLDKAQARMDRFSKEIGARVAKIGSTFQAIGGAISIGVTAPVMAAGTAAYNMAADFEDALGATDQIFKSSAEEVKKWAGNLETYFGISKKEALEYSNLMGSMLINIGGLTEEQAAKQGAKLIELAGDLTAMYGGRTQDAVRALTGALKGNNTMLDNYGMAVNDALIKTRALEMGLVKQGQEMSLAAKQAATLSLIYEQTSAAQGQAAREANGASGSLRALRTEITNLTTEMGAALLPIITPLVSRLKDVVAGFREMSPGMQQTIVKVAAVVAALGPLMVALGSVMKLAPLVGTAFTAMTGPIGIAVAAVAGAAALIIKNWNSIKAYFTTGAGSKLWKSISEAANQLWQRLSTIFGAIRDFVIGVWDRIGTNVTALVQNAFNIVLSVVDGVMRHLAGLFDAFAALLRGDFKGALEAVKGIFVNIFETLKNVATNAVAAISQQLAGFLKLIGADGLGRAVENFANKLTPARTEIKETTKATEEATKAVQGKTIAFKEFVPTLDDAKKSTRDYRAEMVSLFASWGLYAYQVENLSNQFREIRKTARLAGASLEEMVTIASRELGQKLELALNQFSLTPKKPDFSGLIGGITIPTTLKVGVDFKMLDDRLKQVKSNLEALTLDLGALVSSAITDMASSVGEALATGGNIIDTIGQTLIKTLGNLAKSVGQQMIAFGTAALALKALMKNPFLAIAAGAALVALGSAATAAVGKQVSSVGTGGYQGSQVSSTYNQSPAYQPRGAYEDKVVFEISGDKLKGVLDRVENKNKRRG